jgi:hypothetical protein
MTQQAYLRMPRTDLPTVLIFLHPVCCLLIRFLTFCAIQRFVFCGDFSAPAVEIAPGFKLSTMCRRCPIANRSPNSGPAAPAS